MNEKALSIIQLKMHLVHLRAIIEGIRFRFFRFRESFDSQKD